jgi:hypothetical protein
VAGADTALTVSRDGIIHKLRIWQVEVFHDFPEIFEGTVVSQPGITFSFLCDGGNPSVVIIMAWIYQAVVRQCEQFSPYAPE